MSKLNVGKMISDLVRKTVFNQLTRLNENFRTSFSEKGDWFLEGDIKIYLANTLVVE